ncbi:5' nucleotidase, NT5C type [Clostridium tagluense]|uniref:5'(3')-deoxyribonucleotidase n=1 Tax=Clostridium tagluense TaxID=360422 RepID=A0A401UTP1_9CLOT|nr:5'-3'-deoxyribonucleotidase [Clostridium tagluense]GCD12881.1 5'(3')-deoxyribonucleotidase [Clostridium tagluense]
MKINKYKIGVDQDWVLAKLTKKWIQYYNTIFNDNLRIDDITDWNLAKSIKSEAILYMNNILKLEDFYRNLGVVSNSQRVLKKLQEQGHEIFIVTDPFSKMSYTSKYDWLVEYFPFIDTKNFIFTGNKRAIKLDFLIDDGIHNCEGFQGISLLYDSPYNRKCDKFYRVKDWNDIEYVFENRINSIIDAHANRERGLTECIN